jgi:uncharacterized membrane protein YphA (DoxX/SURF4 family)
MDDHETISKRPHWFRALSLRCTIVYVFLYFLSQPINGIPLLGPVIKMVSYYFWVALIQPVAKYVFGIQQLQTMPNGSGDTTFHYLHVLCCLALSLLVGCIWTWLDRRRRYESQIIEVMYVYLRYMMAATMISYGIAKFPTAMCQFPPPEIAQLQKTYGESSPMNLLWTFMGSSQAYTLFSGIMELVSGILLLMRRTTPLGGLMCMAVSTNIAMLNLCYDVPVKLLSLHMVFAALLILGPDAKRIVQVLMLNQATEARSMSPMPESAYRFEFKVIHAVFKGIAIVLLFLPNLVSVASMMMNTTQNQSQSRLFGSYEVISHSLNGVPLPPDSTLPVPWRSMSFDKRPFPRPDASGLPFETLFVQPRSGQPFALFVRCDAEKSEVGLELQGKQQVTHTLKYAESDDGTMTLSGTLPSGDVVIQLKRLTREDFLLVNRGFHWINEFPYNR